MQGDQAGKVRAAAAAGGTRECCKPASAFHRRAQPICAGVLLLSAGSCHTHFWCRAIRRERSEQQQQAWREDSAAQDALRASISFVLEQLFVRHSEVPYIAAFCKEVRPPEDCMPSGN